MRAPVTCNTESCTNAGNGFFTPATSPLGRFSMAGLDEVLSDTKHKRREYQGSEAPQITHDDASSDSDLTRETQYSAEALSGDEEEFELLQASSLSSTPEKSAKDSKRHDYITAPLMTRGALLEIDLPEGGSQYGVLGQILSVHAKDAVQVPDDARLYLNTNAPLSALLCGVQGSGKSHTLATMLESMFISSDKRIGTLSKPLSGLVLHLSDGGVLSSPNETAWVANPRDISTESPKVVVYVSPSSLNTMKVVYRPLGPGVEVRPLYFTEDELDARAFLSMMAVGSSQSAPLYIQIILSILRELGEKYSYQAFKMILEQKRKGFSPQQEAGLKQRIALLESFMAKSQTRKAPPERFAAGQVTIVDLSDPFIDPASACGLFEVVTRLFVRANVDTGKIIVVDEAHKYLTTGSGSSGLTKTLLTLIREQRHKGMRIIISTQEPTVVPPVLIDLCTLTILHRFSSPAWWEHVIKHVSADLSGSNAFDTIVKLQTGEAIVLVPSGLHVHSDATQGRRVVSQFGRRYLHVRMRRRITEDGGSSIMVV